MVLVPGTRTVSVPQVYKEGIRFGFEGEFSVRPSLL